MFAIQAKNLSKRYQNGHAVQDLSLQVGWGEIFALLGQNGSGKSTTLKMLAGILEPTSGEILICGDKQVPGHAATKRKIGVLSEETALIDVLSAKENLLLAARAYGVDGQEAETRVDFLLEILDLVGHRHRFPGQLSYGMGKKLALAMALVHNPKVLILDEPFEGIDPAHAQRIRELLYSLARKGVAVLVSSHCLDILEKIVDRFAILSSGHIVFESTREETLRDGTRLEDIYFQHVDRLERQEIGWIG